MEKGQVQHGRQRRHPAELLEAQIIKGDTLETLGGAVKSPQSLAYKYLVLCNTKSSTMNGSNAKGCENAYKLLSG